MSVPEMSSGTFSSTDGGIPYEELLSFTDAQLLDTMRGGNTDAFEVLFKRYHRLIQLRALRILRDIAEAEDLTQVVFMEIYRNMRQVEPVNGSLKVWLLQRAHSRSVNRRNYLLVRQFHSQVEMAAIDEQQGIWSPRRSVAHETFHVMNEILSALPEAQRQTIQMHFFEGLSLRDIAQKRDETFSNVRNHYYRGLMRLRDYLEKGIRQKPKSPYIVPSGEV
jgi:RNA polymerase sigma-70 factor (ECF subfamily)